MSISRYIDLVSQSGRNGRALSPFESIHALVCETTVLSTLIDGTIDRSALTAAWHRLVTEHPVLTATIGFGADGLCLTVDPAVVTPTEVTTNRVDPSGTTTAPIPLGRPVAGVDVTADGPGGSWVSLVTHHAIADGILMYHWLGALWQHYCAQLRGTATVTTDPQPIPAAPEAVLAARGITKGTRSGAERLDGVKVYPFHEPVGRDAGHDPLALHRVVTELSADDTAALHAAATSHNSTLHGLICGAILVAERELLDVDGAVPIGLISHVNIRNRMSPPAGPAEGTNLVGYSCAQVAVAPADAPSVVGDEVLRQLHTDLDEGVVVQTCLHIPEMIVRWAGNDNLEPISVSNIGEFAPLELPDGLRVIDFHIRGNANYAVLAGNNPPDTLPLSTGRHHAVFSYDDRLHVETVYPAAVLTHERTLAFGARIRELLTAAARAV